MSGFSSAPFWISYAGATDSTDLDPAFKWEDCSLDVQPYLQGNPRGQINEKSILNKWYQ